MDLTTAPWWGIPVIAGSFLIVGALIGLLNGLRSDRARFKREDARRWDTELLTRSGAFMAATANCFDQLRIMHESVDRADNIPDAQQLLRQMTATTAYQVAFLEHSRTQSELSLIAPDSVRNASMDVGVELLKAQLHETSRSSESIESSVGAQLRFIEAVRSVVGVPTYGETKKRPVGR